MRIINKFKQNPFQYILILCLLVVFVILFPKGSKENIALDKGMQIKEEVLHVFVQKSCVHCVKAKKFLDTIEENYPNIEFQYHDLADQRSVQTLLKYAAKLDVDVSRLGTPTFISGDKCIIGFDEKSSKEEIKSLLEKRNDDCKKKVKQKTVKLPLFGEIDLFDTSLPVLTAIMGLADGFNPCAMWVLVYLISIVAGLSDTRKIWFLVGSFVLTSGILYFLFMTAWLNVFLYLGYVRILAIAVGLFALYFGIMSIYEFIKNRGEMVCKLSNNESRKRSMNKIERLVSAELSMLSILGIIALAFVVNSIEFACSAALPAIFTYVLTQAQLSTLAYYMYILLYTLFFMLDDFVIFGLAVFAVNKYIGSKYAKYSGIIGGILMISIGVLIVFFPNALR